MKILFLTTQLPYPPVSGGVIKTWKLIERFTKEFEVHLITVLKNEDKLNEDEFLKKVTLKSYYSKEINIARTPINLIKSYVTAKTLNIYRNYDVDVQQEINRKAQMCDVIFVDHYEMYAYITENMHSKAFLHQHNAEFVMWERLAHLQKNPIKKWILKLESMRIKRAEKIFCTQAKIIFAAPNDINELSALGIPKNKFEITYHLGDDSAIQKPDLTFESTEKAIIYLGTLSWEANVDGLLWFFENCWKQIKAKVPDTVFYVIGKNPDVRLTEVCKNDSSVIFTGFIEDPEEYYQKARVAIAPLRFGSGTKVKVLTYMYRGIPTVTSAIGTEGLDIENEKHMFITSDLNKYANYCVELLENTNTCKAMSKASRLLGLEKYSWDKMLSQHTEKIKSVF